MSCFAASAQPAAEAPAAKAERPAESTQDKLDRLFEELARAEEDSFAEKIAGEISRLWAQSGSPSMDLLLERGREALEEGERDKAIEHLSRLTELAPEFAEGWNSRATAYFAEDDYWRAMEDIERALALEPRHFGALTGLALILERVERKASALAAWREVRRLRPGSDRAERAIDRLKIEVEGRDI